MIIRFFTTEQFHAKSGIGSTRLRVHNLLKYWPEAGIYKFGEKPDVLIFQKVYSTIDYKLPVLYEGLKILDICDPDWKDTPDILIKETIDAVDGVVASSQTLCDYLQSMTDTPCRLIKDRFELSEFPAPKVHSGPIKRAVWFGYSHNAITLRMAVRSLAQRDISLTVIADDDPFAYRWSENKDYEKKYKYIKFNQETLYKDIQTADVVVFPVGTRPFDRFKSQNKTVIANLLGIPIAQNTDDLDRLNDHKQRNDIDNAILKREYDVKLSVKQYKEFIDELSHLDVSK